MEVSHEKRTVRGARVTMSLDPQTLALVRIAVATATGDERSCATG